MTEIPEGGFTDGGQLEAWLTKLPKKSQRPTSIIVANRAAIRIMPLIARQISYSNSFILAMFVIRSIIISRVGGKFANFEIINAASVAGDDDAAYAMSIFPTDYTESAAAAAIAAANSVNTWDNRTADFVSTMSAAAAAADSVSRLLAHNFTNAAHDHGYQPHAAARSSYAKAAKDSFWLATTHDAQAVEEKTANFRDMSLWSGSAPNWWKEERDKFNLVLSSGLSSIAGSNPWLVWRDWYDSRVDGGPSWGLTEKIADELETRIALGDGREDFWDRDPAEVNAEIAEWVEDARKKAKENSKPDQSIGQFFVEALRIRAAPMSIDEIRDAFRQAEYKFVDKTLRGTLGYYTNHKIINRVSKGIYVLPEFDSQSDILEQKDYITLSADAPDIEMQTKGALQFDGETERPLGVKTPVAGRDWAIDVDSRERHGEARRLADRLMRLCDGKHAGNNALAAFKEDFEYFAKSLGAEIENLNPNLLIPRADNIRKTLAAYDAADDFSKLDPLPNDVLLQADAAMSAYNVYIALDSALAFRDEALFGPDARKRIVAPAEGQAKIADSVKIGVAKLEVEQAASEEAKAAPENPDAESRPSRRYSESVKNFARAVIARAVHFAKFGAASGTALYAAAAFVWHNKSWFIDIFADNPTMTNVLGWLLEALKHLPLG